MDNNMLAELDEVVPEGYALVPINPSAQMLDAAVYAQEPNMGSNRGGSNNVNRLRRRAQRVYAVMLKVAAHEQEVALSSSGAAQGEAKRLEAAAEAKPSEGRTRAKLIATLADMAKRLEAADRDSKRLDWLCSGKVYWLEIQSQPSGGHVYVGPPENDKLRRNIDAAIDATQEGEG